MAVGRDEGCRRPITSLDSTNEQPLDYYLLPRLDFTGQRVRFADRNRFELEGYRFENLDYLWQMGAQMHLRKLA